MTTLRPEHEAGQGGSYEQGAYEDSGAFEAAVEGLADPLNDPLPGQRGPGPVPGPGRGRRRRGQVQGQVPGNGGVPGPGSAAGPGGVPVAVPGQGGAPASAAGQAPVPQQSPWSPAEEPAVADPESEWSGDYYRQYAAETPPGARSPQGEWSGAPPYYTDGQAASGPLPSPSPAPASVPSPSVPSPSASASASISGVGAGAVLDDETVGLRTTDTRRAVVPGPGADEAATAVIPVVEAPAEPAVEPVPRTGGRAERRKAAAKGGRGRRRSEPVPAGSGAASGAEQGSEGPSPARPLSRVEARRAARAAKDSLAVVASRVVGELFITFGVLMLLFVTYQLWWTNVRADVYAGKETNKIQESFAKGRQPGAFEPGQGFAIMHIPKLDVVVPIAEGISKAKVLDHGMVGHYAEGSLKTAMPSDKQGNFAVAGHRNTHGEPFRYINQLQPGDEIIVETRDAYYTYDMTSILPQTAPSNVSVIGPVPPGSGFTEPGRYITLTTCTPEFTSTYRMIVWGKMVEERPRSKGKPDALVG
ncbi:class E sortase [Streptomyces sp. MnatMP-M17]|uniref:class E sortase n=1 Tax=unclassified Streptomyces TaxID=2593676 RepID=UPI00081D5B9F|nr:class E sortase [Streptomyces sp. MnatMP-M17]MYZ40935.1 class E sortase [Streptomyces sp. SID4917]SCG09004.1 sortase A [Streptomyces sp. MnatMP-M17]